MRLVTLRPAGDATNPRNFLKLSYQRRSDIAEEVTTRHQPGPHVGLVLFLAGRGGGAAAENLWFQHRWKFLVFLVEVLIVASLPVTIPPLNILQT